jgi:hypothetical protein
MASSGMLRRVALVRTFTAVTMKNSVFWDVTPGDSCKDDILHSHRRENLKSYKLLYLSHQKYFNFAIETPGLFA